MEVAYDIQQQPPTLPFVVLILLLLLLSHFYQNSNNNSKMKSVSYFGGCGGCKLWFMLITLYHLPLWQQWGVQSYPYFLLSNSEPKCITFTSAHETTLFIQYNLPDLVQTTTTGPNLSLQQQQQQPPLDAQQHGLDAHYQRMMDQKLKLLQASMAQGPPHEMNMKIQLHGSDMYDQGTFDAYTGEWTETIVTAPPLHYVLTKPKDVIITPTASRNGMVEVCVASNRASSHMPVLVSLNITEQSTFEYEEELKQKQALAQERRRFLEDQHRLAEDHMYQISHDLKGLEYKLQFVMNHADHRQHQDESFRIKSIQLRRNVIVWPKVKLAILIVTSLWQAHHILQFFKRHYI